MATARPLQAAAAVVLALGLLVVALQDGGDPTGITVRPGPREVAEPGARHPDARAGAGKDASATSVATTPPPSPAAVDAAVEAVASPHDDGGPARREVEVVEEARADDGDAGAVEVPAAAPAPAAPVAAAPAPVSIEVAVLSDAEATLLYLANQQRAAGGLGPLASAGHLQDVARRWALHLATTGVLTHNPSYPEQIRAGRDCTVLAENVAYRMPVDAYAMHQQLMASPTHAANILDPRVTHVGIAVATDAGGRMWAVQNFCG